MVSFYNEDPDGLIVSKHSKLGADVAYVSWARVARCSKFDEDLARKFIDEFGFKGPESCKSDIEQGCFRKENMTPGNG